jgi:hypothetical protein
MLGFDEVITDTNFDFMVGRGEELAAPDGAKPFRLKPHKPIMKGNIHNKTKPKPGAITLGQERNRT